MDELAEKSGQDPLDFRLAHLDDPRAVDVIRKVREMTARKRSGDKEGIGYAFSRYKNQASYCAVGAKVRMDDKDKPIITHIWAAIDSGEIINPDGLRNQTEGGLLQSASWTMLEKVKFNQRHVSSLNWYSYPVFRYQDVPEVRVELIDRPQEPPLGTGEAAQGPASAAIVNAIYKASGKRVRNLPVNSAF